MLYYFQNDQARIALYNTKWYLLSISDQQRLKFVLHRSQNAVEMTIGGLALLNMETFVAVSMYDTYTFSMHNYKTMFFFSFNSFVTDNENNLFLFYYVDNIYRISRRTDIEEE